MTLGLYFAAVPWALPTLAVGALLVLLASGPVARRLGWARAEAALLGVSLVAFLAVTTTPNPRNGRPMDATRTVDLAPSLVGWPELAELHREPTLNVWLAVPMGACAAYVALRRSCRWPVLVALLVPPAAELVQLALPPLGRSAFLLADLTANAEGVLLGGAVGLVAAVASSRVPAPSR